MTNSATAVTPRPPHVDPALLREDPLAPLAALRRDHGVIAMSPNVYMALRAGDVLDLLARQGRGTRQAEGHEFVRISGVPEGVTARLLTDFMLFSNDRDHRTKRGLFARSFAHRRIAAERPRIRAVANRIVGDLPRGAGFDFTDLMSARVPAHMIAALLGLPPSEAPVFTQWVYQVSRAVSPVYPVEDHADIERACSALCAYVEAHLRARLSRPQDDMLSELVTNWKQDPTVTFDVLVHQVVGLVIAGSDTTRASFSMLVALLLRTPGNWEAVRADRGLIPGAVAEALRYEPVAGNLTLLATEDLQVSGHSLPAGSVLRLSLLSAMRDPAMYADPDRFDITRTDHPRLHLAFGMGAHRCIGEMLARIEMEEGLAALLDAAPQITLERTPRMLGFGGIRQITAMQVRIG